MSNVLKPKLAAMSKFPYGHLPLRLLVQGYQPAAGNLVGGWVACNRAAHCGYRLCRETLGNCITPVILGVFALRREDPFGLLEAARLLCSGSASRLCRQGCNKLSASHYAVFA